MKLLAVLCVFMAFSGLLAIPVNDIDLEAEAANTTAVIPVSLVTEETTTIKPITIETVTTASEGPTAASLEPISTTNNSPSTGSTQTTPSTAPVSSNTPSSTTVTPAPPAKESGFDGASFGGGIGTGIGICLVMFIAWKCYTRRQSKGYSTM